MLLVALVWIREIPLTYLEKLPVQEELLLLILFNTRVGA